MIEICKTGIKNLEEKHPLNPTPENTLEIHYPTRLYERLRDKPLQDLDDWEVHYILEQLLGGDNY